MKLFSADPAAALDKAHAKLATVHENIADLRAKRSETLLAAEDASAVTAIDRAIEAEEANARIYTDRIKALQEECRKQTYANREKERGKAIAAIKQKLKRREQIAADLQNAIERVGTLYSELVSRDELEILWPFPRPGGGFAVLDLYSVRREIAWALHGLVSEHRLPEPSSAGLGVTGITAQGIDGVVRPQGESIIQRLAVVPIGEDLMDEAING